MENGQFMFQSKGSGRHVRQEKEPFWEGVAEEDQSGQFAGVVGPSCDKETEEQAGVSKIRLA